MNETQRILTVMTLHAAGDVLCDEHAETNVIVCRCGYRCGPPRPTYGAALEQWRQHVATKLDVTLRPN